MSEMWCFYQNIDNGNGPFDSRGEAIAEGRGYYGDEDFHIARCFIPDPADYVTADALDLVVHADEEILQGASDIDECFCLYDDKKAQESLDNLIRKWAAEHVYCSLSWYSTGEGEELIEGAKA